ncbi:competence protein CoiA [Alkalibacillus almallahensis]|uniref:competence protein CoiA n=1 Tax=Alkalibacillus almallahensis TaxID=1379154 RepID=UPI001422426B|nr:competence protein CoiA family protein [Alkalibacillus almallahensis]NIK13213.1 competence CoiA-like predicted nuclease [Alkalibacillus almallahensis]
MLKAINKNNQSVIAFSQSKERLDQLRHEPLFCPACQKPVILKAGSINIPHFAHDSDLPCSYGKGESETHLRGKMHIATWLHRQSYPVYLEQYIPPIDRRADVLTKINDTYIAFEYQCSPIEPEELRVRTEDYMKQGIVCIWIFGPNFHKPYQASFYRVAPAIRVSLLHHPYAKTPRFFTYNPTNYTLHLHEPNFVHQHNAFTTTRSDRVTNWTIPQIFASKASQSTNLQQWLFQKKRFRSKQRQFASKIEEDYMNYLYTHSLHPQFLPSCIYLPVANYHLDQTPVYIWQTSFIIDLFNELEQGDELNWYDVYDMMRVFFQNRLTAAYPTSFRHPLYSYLDTLVSLDLLEKRSPSHFVKKADVIFPKTLDEALEQDEATLNQLFNCMPNEKVK